MPTKGSILDWGKGRRERGGGRVRDLFDTGPVLWSAVPAVWKCSVTQQIFLTVQLSQQSLIEFVKEIKSFTTKCMQQHCVGPGSENALRSKAERTARETSSPWKFPAYRHIKIEVFSQPLTSRCHVTLRLPSPSAVHVSMARSPSRGKPFPEDIFCCLSIEMSRSKPKRYFFIISKTRISGLWGSVLIFVTDFAKWFRWHEWNEKQTWRRS